MLNSQNEQSPGGVQVNNSMTNTDKMTSQQVEFIQNEKSPDAIKVIKLE